jgi:hypothetical protein
MPNVKHSSPATQPVDTAAVASSLAPLARLGYAAKGLLYVLVGGLAALTAGGYGGRITDTQGALATLYHQAFGQLLVAAVALGLAGYALWNLARAVLDLERKGTDLGGWLARLGYAFGAFSSAGLAFAALQFLLGTRRTGESSDTATRDGTAWLMQQPFGLVLVGLVGLGVVGFGLFQFYRAAADPAGEHLDLRALPPGQQRIVVRCGQLGLAARGVVACIIGSFLLLAAWRHNPQEATGLSGALAELLRQPYGDVVLGVVACGLVAHGLFSLAESRYRRLHAG